jgi:hypothetical protein
MTQRAYSKGATLVAPVNESIVIDRRFRGPPASAQGGYAAGLVAERVPGPCAAVALRAPPPLDRPLTRRGSANGAVALLDGDRVLAEGGPADLHLDVPDAVAWADAVRASAASPWADRHPFPGCFGCGPERSQDEAVAITAGTLDGTDRYAGPWVPLADFAGADGAVTPLFTWAALDCPTAAPVAPYGRPCVLANLTVRVVAPIAAGLPHTVVAWTTGHDGRKHRGGAAIHGPDGQLCAYSEGLWIELRDPSTMGALSST